MTPIAGPEVCIREVGLKSLLIHSTCLS